MERPPESLWTCCEHLDFQSCYDSWRCIRRTQLSVALHPGCVGTEKTKSLNIPGPESARGVKERSLPLLWHCLFRTEHFKAILLCCQPFGRTMAKCCLWGISAWLISSLHLLVQALLPGARLSFWEQGVAQHRSQWPQVLAVPAWMVRGRSEQKQCRLESKKPKWMA